jgi:hypothetical protein
LTCLPRNRTVEVIGMVLVVLLAGRASGEPVSVSCRAREAFEAGESTCVIHLSHRLVIADSDSLELGGKVLVRDLDYRMDYAQGIIYLKAPPVPGDSIAVCYAHLPAGMKPTYCLRSVARNSVVEAEVCDAGSRRVEKSGAHDIKASGSKSVSIETGSLSDLRINQALNLSISGTLGNDVEIRGVLSDRDAGFTGTGSTSRLKDLDRIFMEVRSTDAFARVGDLEIDESPGELLKVKRNMTGFLGSAAYGSGEVVASGAASRSRYESVEIRGRESISGPYVINGPDGEPADIVKHTEKVWLEGVEMSRGSEADYAIDYARSEIYFSPRHMIREDARIIVDYEARKNDDRRQFYFGRTSLDLGDRTSVAVSFVNEGYSPGDSDILANAPGVQQATLGEGDWVDGGRFVGAGMGRYARVELDTLRYYEFVGEGRGDYEVTFTRVGEGKGRYSFIQSEEFDAYIHVFTGRGDYTDMVRSQPRLQAQVVHLNTSVKPAPWLEVTSEAARSEGHCRQSDNTWTMETDRAYTVGLKATHRLPDLGQTSLGSLNIGAGRRSIGTNFIGFDRIRRPDFLEVWAQEPDGGFEKSNYVDVTHTLGEVLKTTFEAGTLETGVGDSRRYKAGIDLGSTTLGVTASNQAARMLVDGVTRGSESNAVAVRVPVKPVLLSAGRTYELRARLRDSTSTRRTEYFSRADLGGKYGGIRIGLSTVSEERDHGAGWMEYASIAEGKAEFDTKMGKALALRGGVSQRMIDYAPASGLGDLRATGADFHINLRDVSVLSAMSLDYRLANTLSTVYATRLVKVESGDYDSLGNYRPESGGYALSRYETGMQPVTHVKAGLMVELGRKGKVILDRSVSARTVIDVEGEDGGGRLERVALLESGYLLNSPDAVYGLIDVMQEVVMRRNRGLTVSASGRGSRLLDARCPSRKEQRRTLEFAGRVSSSGLKGVSAWLEGKRTTTTTEWHTETGVASPRRRISSGVLSLQRRVGAAFESSMKFELTNEDRTEPRSGILEARLGPGFTLFAGPLRCDANLGIRSVLRSETDVPGGKPRRDSVDWSSRVYTRHGRYTSLSVEYSGHRYQGLEAVHSLRASLSATF